MVRLPAMRQSARRPRPPPCDNPVSVIIEAPGKVRRVRALLKRIGWGEARVLATKGHVCAFPAKLTPLGIGPNLEEALRGPRHDGRLECLAEATRGHDVYLMTDPDQEGDVIAQDVAEAVGPGAASVWRCSLRGLTEDHLLEALAKRGPLVPDAAVPGRARALVDRLVGALFSRDGIASGRVLTALLGAVDAAEARGGIPSGRAVFSLAAADGGLPFTASAPARPEAAARLQAVLDEVPGLTAAAADPSERPWNMGDAMIAAHEETGLEPVETEAALQEAYESGLMSYPRTSAHEIHDKSLGAVRESVIAAGGRTRADSFGHAPTDGIVHEALHPLEAVGLAADIAALAPPDGVLVLVARNLATIARARKLEQPDPEALAAAAPGIARLGLQWRRRAGPRAAWERDPRPGFIPWSPETAMVALAMRRGLGRPSTWANHATRFVGRGLLDEHCRLTPKARRWIAGSDPDLLESRRCAGVEQRLALLSGGGADGGLWGGRGSLAPAVARVAGDCLRDLGVAEKVGGMIPPLRTMNAPGTSGAPAAAFSVAAVAGATPVAPASTDAAAGMGC